MSLAARKFCQYLQSDDFKKRIFDGTANSVKLTVENDIYYNFDEAAIDWEKKHIEDIFLETVEKKLGKKCFEYCKTLKLLRNTFKKLKYTKVWSRVSSAIIPTGVFFGTMVGGSMINPLLGTTLTTVEIAGVLFWKVFINEFEATREKTFNKKIESFSQGSVEKKLRETYAPVVTETIKTMIKTTLTKDIKTLEKNIEAKIEDLCSNDYVIVVISSLNSTISGLNTSLRAIQFKKCVEVG